MKSRWAVVRVGVRGELVVLSKHRTRAAADLQWIRLCERLAKGLLDAGNGSFAVYSLDEDGRADRPAV